MFYNVLTNSVFLRQKGQWLRHHFYFYKAIFLNAKIEIILREEICAGIFANFFADITRELTFANWALLRILRELIFANLA